MTCQVAMVVYTFGFLRKYSLFPWLIGHTQTAFPYIVQDEKKNEVKLMQIINSIFNLIDVVDLIKKNKNWFTFLS